MEKKVCIKCGVERKITAFSKYIKDSNIFCRDVCTECFDLQKKGLTLKKRKKKLIFP